MKKVLIALICVMVLSINLASCGADVPRPEIKEGRFNISVTYEYNGEIRTASGVYVCEYGGIIRYNPNRESFVNWKESFEGDIEDGGILPICTTEDGGKIFIGLLLYPEYFMGDPEYADRTPIVRAEIFYSDYQSDDEALIAEYGVKLISYECDAPIENTFK